MNPSHVLEVIGPIAYLAIAALVFVLFVFTVKKSFTGMPLTTTADKITAPLMLLGGICVSMEWPIFVTITIVTALLYPLAYFLFIRDNKQ